MSYSKPWIHKAAWRSLQLLRSPIHLFLIEISSVLSHTQSYPLSISKAYLGLAKPQSHVLDVRQIRSVPSKCAEREKHLPLHIWFPSFTHLCLLQTTVMKTMNTSTIRKNGSPLPHPHPSYKQEVSMMWLPFPDLPGVNSLPGQWFYPNQ